MSDLAVAAQVNPGAGFDRINSILGVQSGMLELQQKRQALQVQAQQLQQEQLRTQQQQGVAFDIAHRLQTLINNRQRPAPAFHSSCQLAALLLSPSHQHGPTLR